MGKLISQFMLGDRAGWVLVNATDGVNAAIRTSGKKFILQVAGGIVISWDGVRIFMIFKSPLLFCAV
jgi:hypothetical protein